jgi:UDP-2,3-diacylglucosamine hydrolase
MRKVFIADAHLRNPCDENYRVLLRFLSELHGTTETLFILGDLFEFWIGYRTTAFPHYQPILEHLRKLSATGTEIVYFEGNHDFHMGKHFSETVGATIFPAPAVLSLDGRKCLLCHGDQINTHDYGHRLLRFLLHNRVTKALFPLFPPGVACRIADHMSRHSKGNHGKRNARWNYELLLNEFADARFREGFDAVICAHFHLPLLSKRNSGRMRTLLSLGDWITQYSYGELRDGNLSLHQYH